MTTLQAIDEAPARRAPFGHPVVGSRGGDTRRKILDGTMAAIADVGFDAVHPELIAERAGCSRPAFYQYFESKHEVFWALAGELGEEMVNLAGQLGTVTPDRDGVTHLAEWIGEFMVLHRAWEPVFSSFQAASRDHLQQAKRSSRVSVRTDAALLDAFGLSADGLNDRLMGAMVALLDRSSFYAEQLPADVSRHPFDTSLAELFHRVFYGPIEGVNVDPQRRIRRHRPVIAAPLTRTVEELPPKKALTRQKLLDAGLKVLPARGFHDTRVDDISDLAGLSHGTFYRYFANKDDFFTALAESAAIRAIDLVAALPVDGTAADVSAWVTDWFHTYQSDGGIISTWQEMRTSVDLRHFSEKVSGTMFARLVRHLERRPFGNPEADATSLLALLERLPNNVYTLGFTSEDDGVEILVTILRRGYFAAAG